MSNLLKYSLGFMFNPGGDAVMLIRKARPKWQEGLLNGVGGSILPGEKPIVSMTRECEEETGIVTEEKEWTNFANLHGVQVGDLTGNKKFVVHCYFSFNTEVERFDKLFPNGRRAGSPEARADDEEVAVYNVGALTELKTLPNTQWLIPMALSMYPRDRERARCFDVTEQDPMMFC